MMEKQTTKTVEAAKVVKKEMGQANPTWKMLAKDVFRAGCLVNSD